MNGYEMRKSVPPRAEQVFGTRDFFMRGRIEGVSGELIRQGNEYFARIGKDTYRATLMPYEDGRRWIIEANPC